MKTLMYPIAPEDDFPETFCAIRQGSGEHQFYTPEGESASWMLFRAESENAKIREQLAIASDMARDYDGDRRLLRELVRDYHRFADAMCAERDCDGCSQRDEGACKRGVLTSRECVLEVDV